MDLPVQVLIGGTLAVGVAYGLAAVARRPWGGAVGLGAGFCAGSAVVVGVPAFPPRESIHWLPIIALAAAAWGAAEPRWGSALSVRIGARAILAGVVPPILLAPALRDSGAGGAALVGAAVAIAILVPWVSVEALARRRPGPVVPFVLVAQAAGVSAALAMSGSIRLGLLGGVLAAATAGVAAATLWRSARFAWSGAIPVAAVLLPALLACGVFYSETPAWIAILLVAAPSVAWAGGLWRGA